MNFRIGGKDALIGEWPNGMKSEFRAQYFDIKPNERIVYVYEMLLDGVKISTSLATIDFEPKGKGTRMVLTEQHAFVDGYEDNGSREPRYQRSSGSVCRVRIAQELRREKMRTSAYLNFDGNCAEAFRFYAKTFPARGLHIMTQGDMKKDAASPEKDWVIHAYLKVGDADLAASDTFNMGYTRPSRHACRTQRRYIRRGRAHLQGAVRRRKRHHEDGRDVLRPQIRHGRRSLGHALDGRRAEADGLTQQR